GKYSLQKRRYTKGYYIAHSGKKAEQNLKAEKAETLQFASATPVEETVKVIASAVKEENPVAVNEQASTETELPRTTEKKQNKLFSFDKQEQKKGGTAGVAKEELNPPYQYGYGYNNGGMGAWGMIGAISSIISLIIFLIYLAYILEIFTGGTMSGAIVAGLIVIVAVIAIVGIVLALSMGGV
ncbi:MAG TPA: hypothetical protein PLU73_07440, partial [Bacteroidia bacterium]|nr:hypothetical protein [Bacteroidia bacterium]